MKNLMLIFCIIITLLLCTNYSCAQKVKYDNDTIMVDGKPYAIMKKQNVGPMRNDFVVSGLSGTELIYFKSILRRWTGTGFKFGQNEELFYEANFIATGSKAELKHYTGNGFAKLIVENNLIKANAIDPESEKRFILLNNGTMPSTTKTNSSDKSPSVIVNINNNIGNSSETKSNESITSTTKSKSPVTLNGNKIMRDDKVIGKFKQDTTTSNYSQKSIIVTIYSEGGEKVAEASVPVLNPEEWNVKILSENKSYSIFYDSPNEKENLFKWLADKNYLKD